jgi:hypothetical protein
MMKIKIIDPVIADGKAREAGKVLEVSDYEARQLIAVKKAVKFVGDPVAKKEDSPDPAAKPRTTYRKKGDK